MSICFAILLVATLANGLSAISVYDRMRQTTRSPYQIRLFRQTTRSFRPVDLFQRQTTRSIRPVDLFQRQTTRPSITRTVYQQQGPMQPLFPKDVFPQRSTNLQHKKTPQTNTKYTGNSTQNSTFVTYVCNKGVCVRRYTVGFYSTVSIGGLCGLIILVALAVVGARRRQAAALHYSIVSDADSRPLITNGHGLSIQCDPVLLART